MRRSNAGPEHAEAVSRRLATLSAELAGVRGEALEPTRVRGAVPAPPPLDAPSPVVVPVPGRHAARRRGPGGMPGAGQWLARLGVERIGPWHVAVVMGLVALAVGVAAWLVVDTRAEQVTGGELGAAAEPLTPMAPPGVASDGVGVDGVGLDGSGSPSAQQPGGDVTVDVAGKVRSPGIAVLPAGSRVVDALEAAGGARRGVDLTPLNLARVLVDGEQIVVGVPASTGAGAGLGDPGTAAPAGALVNLNTADQAALETLPGVGPVTAAAVISWRTENGGFSSVDELVEVDGIGEVTMARLAPLVTI